MKKTLFKVISILFWVYTAMAALFCIFDVIVGGLFAAATDIVGGIGLALVVTVGMLAQCALGFLTALNLKKLDKLAFKYSFFLMIVSIPVLVFCLIGRYWILSGLFGILLPIALTLCMRMKNE